MSVWKNCINFGHEAQKQVFTELKFSPMINDKGAR